MDCLDFLSTSIPISHCLVLVVQPYSSGDIAIAWNNSCFILSERSDFDISINSSSYFVYSYIDFAFSRQDIATGVYELVYWFQRLGI